MIKLICFYTSGIKPLGHNELLPNHDDWGLKYLQPVDTSPVIKWQKSCENLYMEAKSFLKEESEGVFARSWKEEEYKYLGFVISSRESKGAMRRNALIAIFNIGKDDVPQKIISNITFNDKYLPHGLKEIKKDTVVSINISPEEKISCSCLIKIGPPVEMQKKDESRTTTTYVPIVQIKKSIIPWLIAGTMTVVAAFTIINREQMPIHTATSTSMQPTFFKKEIQHNEELELENSELRQKLDIAHSSLRKKDYELEQKDTIATEIGGWESLKVLIEISKKYQIDRAEKLKIVLERYKREIEQLKQKNQKTLTKYNNEQQKIKNIQFELKTLFDYLEKNESSNSFGNRELKLDTVKWKYMKKKLLTLIEDA